MTSSTRPEYSPEQVEADVERVSLLAKRAMQGRSWTPTREDATAIRAILSALASAEVDAKRYRFARGLFLGANYEEGSFTLYAEGAFRPRQVSVNPEGFDNAMDNAIDASLAAMTKERG